MTLILEGDLDILKMYPHTENEAASSRHSKLELELKKNSRPRPSPLTHDLESERLLFSKMYLHTENEAAR